MSLLQQCDFIQFWKRCKNFQRCESPSGQRGVSGCGRASGTWACPQDQGIRQVVVDMGWQTWAMLHILTYLCALQPVLRIPMCARQCVSQTILHLLAYLCNRAAGNIQCCTVHSHETFVILCDCYIRFCVCSFCVGSWWLCYMTFWAWIVFFLFFLWMCCITFFFKWSRDNNLGSVRKESLSEVTYTQTSETWMKETVFWKTTSNPCYAFSIIEEIIFLFLSVL